MKTLTRSCLAALLMLSLVTVCQAASESPSVVDPDATNVPDALKKPTDEEFEKFLQKLSNFILKTHNDIYRKLDHGHYHRMACRTISWMTVQILRQHYPSNMYVVVNNGHYVVGMFGKEYGTWADTPVERRSVLDLQQWNLHSKESMKFYGKDFFQERKECHPVPALTFVDPRYLPSRLTDGESGFSIPRMRSAGKEDADYNSPEKTNEIMEEDASIKRVFAKYGISLS